MAEGGGDKVGAEEFAGRAMAEIERYQAQFAGFPGSVEVRDDLFSGLMVSSGNLLIGREAELSQVIAICTAADGK